MGKATNAHRIPLILKNRIDQRAEDVEGEVASLRFLKLKLIVDQILAAE
ncbi:hypothetical protein [Leptothermofonsia sp. ETS-13]